MGEHWVGVREAVKERTLRPRDKKAIEVAGRWEEFVSFAALRLGRQLGTEVQEVLSRKEASGLSLRIDHIVESMVDKGTMAGKLRIPNAVGDVDLVADLRATQAIASVKVDAPDNPRAKTRISWLLRQLKDAPDDLRLESWGARARNSRAETLAVAREKPDLLIPHDGREISHFTVSLVRPMGLKRKGARSFVSSVLDTLDAFYADVVQNLREWQPRAPRLSRETPSEPESPADPPPDGELGQNSTADEAPQASAAGSENAE